MPQKRERGICELFAEDAERADAQLFGRHTDKNRRGFLRNAGLASFTAAVGAVALPYNRTMPGGLIPAALAETTEPFVIAGKDGLRVLNDRPINAETPAHLLDDDITPAARFFIRNNGIPPTDIDAKTWTFIVDGEVERPGTFTIAELREQFDVVKLRLQLECGGNGRASFNPPARGNQWTIGAIGNAEWTGVRYADVLKKVGVKASAIYTAHFGADRHLSGAADKQPISRGMPIAKALDPQTLIAFELNGAPIHPMNGAPLRILAPGWPGSVSQKWLNRIQLRDVVHDGAKMTGKSYRVPRYPVAPGQKVPQADFRIIEAMPVKSLISYPRSGVELATGSTYVDVRGHAWAGDLDVTAVDVSIDFGTSWKAADLSAPPNPGSWQRWQTRLAIPQPGYYEVWARATDAQGHAQPFAINWNPKGYLNNSMHRIAVRLAA